MGLPLLHISFKYRPNRVPVPGKGVVSIGHFGAGNINISQFEFGLISISQFTVKGFALVSLETLIR